MAEEGKKKKSVSTLSALFPHSHRLLRMESTWFVFVSLLLAANLLATVLTEGAPTPTTRTVVTQEPVTIPFVKVCRTIGLPVLVHFNTVFQEQQRGVRL